MVKMEQGQNQNTYEKEDNIIGIISDRNSLCSNFRDKSL